MQLTSGDCNDDTPIWSHRGDRIAFVSTCNDPSDPPGNPSSHATPPRDRWGPDSNDIYMIPRTGGTPQRLTYTNNRHTGSPSWSPDDMTLLFSSYMGERSIIYKLNIRTGAYEKLTTGEHSDFSPFWMY
jgi:Tol biopolymer transport system component